MLIMSNNGLLLAQTGLKTLFKSPFRDSILLNRYDSLASTFYKLHDLDKMSFTLQKGEALANKINNKHYQGIFFFHKALFLKLNQQVDSAFIYSAKAIPILQQFKEWKYTSRMLYMQSAFYLDKNESVKAVQNLIVLINFNEKHIVHTYTGPAYHLLALTFGHLGDTFNQKKYLLKYLEFAELQDSDIQRLYIYIAWGRFLTGQKLYRQAHAYFVKAGKIAELLKHEEGKTEIWITMGGNFVAQKEYLKGLRAFHLAETIVLKHINEPGWYKTLATTYTGISSLYLAIGKPKEALDYAFRAFNLLKGKTTAQEYLVPTLKNRITAQKLLGQYHSALNSYEQLLEITNTSDLNKEREIVKTIEAKYQLEKFQKEKELYQKNLRITELELQNEQKQSRLLWILLSISVLLVAGGYWFFRKIQLYNHQIRRKNQELEQSNETKDKLFGIIGHDLRAPVADLNNALILIDGEDITKQQFLSFTGLLRKKTTSLQTILNNLLYWALSQRQVLQTNPQSIPLKNKMEEVLESLHGLIQEKSLRIEWLTDITHSIYADENHVQIVLQNVIHNAIKFSPLEGVIHMEIARKSPLVRLKVTNFSKEFEWDGSIKKLSALPSQFGTLNEKGTGLGLLVCAELIKLNQGTIRAYPSDPTGTTLELNFSTTSAQAIL